MSESLKLTAREEMDGIAEAYKLAWSRALTITETDIKENPLVKRETKNDRVTHHLIGMIEMFSIRFGDPETKLRIVDFLEKQLFRDKPLEDEVCHLTYDMFKDLRKTILAGEIPG